MIKKFSISMFAIALLGFVFMQNDAHTYSMMPPLKQSGAPNHSSCGSSTCHNAQANVGEGSVSIDFAGGLAKYLPGETYEITVSIDDADAARYGFQMVAYDTEDVSNNGYNSKGNFIPDDIITGTNADSDGTQTIGHRSIPANNENEFTFEWVAPDLDEGSITFYVAANAANGNGGKSGDKIYTTNFTIDAEIMNSNEDQDLADFQKPQIFPVPMGDVLNIDWMDFPTTNSNWLISNLSGQILMQANIGSHFNQTAIDLSDLKSGIYILELTNGTQSFRQKILKP